VDSSKLIVISVRVIRYWPARS